MSRQRFVKSGRSALVGVIALLVPLVLAGCGSSPDNATCKSVVDTKKQFDRKSFEELLDQAKSLYIGAEGGSPELRGQSKEYLSALNRGDRSGASKFLQELFESCAAISSGKTLSGTKTVTGYLWAKTNQSNGEPCELFDPNIPELSQTSEVILIDVNSRYGEPRAANQEPRVADLTQDGRFEGSPHAQDGICKIKFVIKDAELSAANMTYMLQFGDTKPIEVNAGALASPVYVNYEGGNSVFLRGNFVQTSGSLILTPGNFQVRGKTCHGVGVFQPVAEGSQIKITSKTVTTLGGDEWESTKLGPGSTQGENCVFSFALKDIQHANEYWMSFGNADEDDSTYIGVSEGLTSLQSPLVFVSQTTTDEELKAGKNPFKAFPGCTNPPQCS